MINCQFARQILHFMGALAAGAALRAEPLKASTFRKQPKLVVLIAFDQMRSDYLTRFHARFLPARARDGRLGGFEALIAGGAYYPFAQQDILQSMTCPGHAMMLSGAYPARMGIPLNDWFDPAIQDSVYCAEDRSHRSVGVSKPASPHAGTSPKNLVGSTFGDELKNAGYPSKVISIALKDRAAIMMGGHRADLAAWFDASVFQWVSSDYYLPDGKLPAWMEKNNEALKLRQGRVTTWKPEGKATGLSNPDKAPRFGNLPALQGFPFQLKDGTEEALFSPEGFTLTESLAEQAVQAESLGRHAGPDLLAVSFSNFDYLGHVYGPNSPEMEELTVQADKTISVFLNFLRRQMPGGLADVAIVLTSDHGSAPEADWAQAQKLPAGRVNVKALTEKMESALTQKFGKPGPGQTWIQFEIDLGFFVNPRALGSTRASMKAVSKEIKGILNQDPAIAVAFTADDVANKKIPAPFERQALKTHYFGRSGDVVAVPKPFFVSGAKPVNHQTGYSYDRGVPLIFFGKRFRPGVYPNPADTVDIAPTLSFVSGVLPPSLSEGRVLSEVLAP